MVLLAVDWSGVSLRWTPKQTHFSTVSGRRLVQGLCFPTLIMDLLTRQQAQHHWFEADPRAKFDDLLEALGLYKGHFDGVRPESVGASTVAVWRPPQEVR